MPSDVKVKEIAFIVPSLSEICAQNEDVVQLLLFASHRLEKLLQSKTKQVISATIISIDHNTAGWQQLISLFSDTALMHISVTVLEEPKVPNLAISKHKQAYDFYEFLKNHAYDEVHSLDYGGLLYYPTQAKQLGLYFLNTVFSLHVVGGTLYKEDANDSILDDIAYLMDDLLERGSLERADVAYVHDRKAWHWYSNKIKPKKTLKSYDVSWVKRKQTSNSIKIDDKTALPIIFYGTLGIDAGLPLFCDVIDRSLSQLERPVEVFFVGPSQQISGMDAVGYIRLRSTKWGVPVTIKREFSISDEIDYIYNLQGIVYCDSFRRDGLRQRLIDSSGLQVLHIRQKDHPNDGLPTPSEIAKTFIRMVQSEHLKYPRTTPEMTKLWRIGRSRLAGLEIAASSPALQLLSEKEPKVSVCITHYNRPQKLRQVLRSLGQQTYKNFEVIIVDDGSSDPGVKQELSKIKREINPLGWRLLIQENKYLGAARNYGATHASGEYLMFMDDDNYAKPNEISTLVAVAKRTGAEIVTAFCDTFENDRDLVSEEPPKTRFTPFGSDPAIGIFSNCYGDANALYLRKAFDKLGGFTEDYGITHEDWEFFSQAALEDVKMICIPEPLFWYRIDANGMYRGQRMQLHKTTNLKRHIRPYLEKLPYYQAKIVQLAQGLLTNEASRNGDHSFLDLRETVGKNSRMPQ